MARPNKKRGFRPIVVDGSPYRWRYGELNATADFEAHLETDAGFRGQRLCVNDGHMNWPTVITSAIVSRIIREAINLGWNPNESGDDFLLELKSAFYDSQVRLMRTSP
jgi:hypothetical protein